MTGGVFGKQSDTHIKQRQLAEHMAKGNPLPLVKLERAVEPYIRLISTKLGQMASNLWIDQANLFEILDNDFLDSKFNACFGLKEVFDRNSNTTPSFNSSDLEIARVVMEGLHLSIDLAIIVPRSSLDLSEMFQRIIAITILMRAKQNGFEPSATLNEIALAIGEANTARKFLQCRGKNIFMNLKDRFAVPKNSLEQGITEGLWAIENEVLEPVDVLRFIGCGGVDVC